MAFLAIVIVAAVCAPAEAKAAAAFQVAFQSDRDGKDSELWLVGSDGTDERALTVNGTPDASPSWSPDGTTIVYACALDRSWDICTIDPTTMLMTRLTDTAADEFDPRFTSDGKKIVMERYDSGRADLAIMPAARGVPKRLVSTPAVDEQDPAPEPGGTRIAFAAGGNIATFDESEPRKRTPVTRGDRGDTDPTVSAGGEIAFATPRDPHKIVVAGSGSTRRITKGTSDDLEPAWSADGTELFFARASRTTYGYRILRVDSRGRGERACPRAAATTTPSRRRNPSAASWRGRFAFPRR